VSLSTLAANSFIGLVFPDSIAIYGWLGLVLHPFIFSGLKETNTNLSTPAYLLIFHQEGLPATTKPFSL
jgi:hypothetical protein